MENLP
ncbi:hypothetical protein BG74_05610, partial [Sodalis-like endosymbiont of Proechinophthirus fluctus]